MSGLIAHAGKIWLAVDPVDMRRGMDGLSMIVQQVLGHPPCAGSAFIFCNRAGNRIKVLLWDGTGVWLCQRRLHQGRFVWPRQDAACVELKPWHYRMISKNISATGKRAVCRRQSIAGRVG
jgi:transposase